jgi:hypothetical protein
MEANGGGIPNFESGKVVLSTGDLKVLKVDLTSKHIDVNVEDKNFVKRIIAMRDQLASKPQNGEDDEAPQVGKTLAMVRTVVEALCKQGITITVSYKGHRIATVGAEAKPILLHHILKTKGVALNSLYTAIKMVI